MNTLVVIGFWEDSGAPVYVTYKLWCSYKSLMVSLCTVISVRKDGKITAAISSGSECPGSSHNWSSHQRF